MEEIEDRVRLLCVFVVAGGRVDEVAALVFGKAEDGGCRVDVTMQSAVGGRWFLPMTAACRPAR